jgi:hypothetical protein
MTAISRDHGGYPIFGGSTLSVTLTVGQLREHGCRPFWVSRLQLGIPGSQTGFAPAASFSDGSPLPLPARTLSA